MSRILLVDDDKVSRMHSEMVLKGADYEVVSASSGAQGISALKSEHFDLLLLDIEMTDSGGIEVLEEIRRTPGISDIKTVFLTASEQRSDITDALRLGALDFIRKPAMPQDLLNSVYQALNKKDRETILAVDDEIMNLMAIEEMLGIRYHVVSVSSGQEALDRLESCNPDMVLLDLHMPGMDGLDVLSRIHDTPGYENLPAVFLTADTDADTEAEIFKAGAMDFIAKPFVMQAALQRIRHVLQLKHLQDSLQDEVDRKTEALTNTIMQIRNLSAQIIQTLSGAIDAKDPYTNGHSNRVAYYARELARRMGKSEKEQDEIYNIALLHDVGKVGISDMIINKPGALTDDEYEEIKQHTVKGYEILKTISEMPALTIGARWHHERYDGTGYPDRLKGEDIPEIARIICVADCYDAMSSNRSYRKALPADKIESELREGSGTQFDPKIAAIMIEMLNEERSAN